MTTFQKRNGRLITIDGVKWKFKTGKNNVVAFSENGEKRCSKIWEVKGVTPNTFERGQWKKTNDGSLFPKEIMNWLSPEEKS